MKKTFDKNYYLSHRGCYEREKMQTLVDANAHDTIADFLNWPIPLKDKFYFVRNYCELEVRQLQELALMCAEVSLKIYEAKYPEDKIARECVNATREYLDGTMTRDVLIGKRNAAYAAADAAADAAAYAAAYAAYAAYAAADAAADAAAYAADAAAYAAAYAADAAAYAAADKTHETNLLNSLVKFCNDQP